MGALDSYRHFVANLFALPVERLLGRLGAHVYDHKKLTVFAMLAVCLAFGAGFSQLEVVTQGEKLWAPQSSESFENRDVVNALFGPEPEFNSVLTKAKGENGNIITLAVMDDLWTHVAGIRAITVPSPGGAGEPPLAWADLCELDYRGRCLEFGSLSHWDFNETLYRGQIGSLDDLQRIMARPTYLNGQEVNFLRTFSEPEFNEFPAGDPQRRLLRATAMDNSFLLRVKRSADAGDADGKDDERHDINKEWASRFLDLNERAQTSLAHAKMLYFSFISMDEEIAASVGNDLPLVAVGYALMVTFASLVLGKVRHRVRARTGLANVGVFSVILSTVWAYGFLLLCGVIFSSLNQLLPFILVGIGVDDMFVLCRGLQTVTRQHPLATLKQRVVLMMRHVGLSITVTSLTDLAAFMLGSITDIPAIKAFCQYAGVAIFFDLIMQVTFFLAFLIWDEMRQEQLRYDCLPCCQRPPGTDIDGKPVTAADEAGADAAAKDQDDGLAATVKSAQELGVMERFVQKRYVPFLLHPVTQVVVVLGYVLAIGLSIYAIPHIKSGMPLEDLAPDGSYVKDYMGELQYVLNLQAGQETMVYWRDIDFATEASQRKVLQSYDVVLAGAYFDADASPPSWLHELIDFAGTANATWVTPVDQGEPRVVRTDVFADALAAFLANPGTSRFNDNIVLDEVSGAIVASRAKVSHTPFTISERKDALVDAKERWKLANDALWGGREVSFVFFEFYVFWEADVVLVHELTLNLVLAGTGVAIVAWLMLIHPGAVLLVVACVAVVDVLIFGLMYATALRLNTVTVVNLVMSIGLAVDALMHTVHFFLATPGKTRAERVSRAMVEMGVSVFQGGVSTFVGIVALAFTTSVIFRSFFIMIAGTVVFGQLTGLLLVPILLSRVGPAHLPHNNDVADSDDGSDVAAAGAAAAGQLAGKSKAAVGGGEADVSSVEELELEPVGVVRVLSNV